MFDINSAVSRANIKRCKRSLIQFKKRKRNKISNWKRSKSKTKL